MWQLLKAKSMVIFYVFILPYYKVTELNFLEQTQMMPANYQK